MLSPLLVGIVETLHEFSDAQSALAAAGLVQFSAGEVQLRRGDVLGPLARGASVDGGDVILTGSSGRAQIRFTDGGLVLLRDVARAELGTENYEISSFYNGKPSSGMAIQLA
mgnify:CR=1 FL=1